VPLNEEEVWSFLFSTSLGTDSTKNEQIKG